MLLHPHSYACLLLQLGMKTSSNEGKKPKHTVQVGTIINRKRGKATETLPLARVRFVSDELQKHVFAVHTSLCPR